MKSIFYCSLIAALISFSGCCGLDYEVDEFCVDQVFVETKTVPLESSYTVNTSQAFIEANVISASTIQNALKVPGKDFTITRIEISNVDLEYSRFDDNTSAALFVNVAAIGNTFNQILILKENLYLPLVDVPATPFTEELNINKYLDGPAIKELKKVLLNYATILNDEGISFILSGQGSPAGTLAHFTLKFKLTLSISYEVCQYAPIGEGIRTCD